MSKYTTEVRYICESVSGLNASVGGSSVKDVIEKSRLKIFDFEYPIFDENYRQVLETKILKHFYTREIGAETVGLWKLWLDRRMNEIMPYYNQLYESTLIEIDPLVDTKIETKHNTKNNSNKNENGTTKGTGTNNANNHQSSDSWRYYSDTPQGGINGISNMDYLTNATHNTDSNNSNLLAIYSDNTENTVISNIDTTEDYIQSVVGKTSGKTYSEMLKEFRDTFLNIDVKIIHELDDLFLNLW